MLTTIPKYRILWTWDYCTLWDDSYFARGRGAYGPNQRRPYFLEDYKRMVDFGAAHRFNGIIIWGALRAHQGGEEQLKELARYGKQKGVRILPGCGIFSYGGVYYDPRPGYDGVIDLPMTPHPYNLHSSPLFFHECKTVINNYISDTPRHIVLSSRARLRL